MDENQRAQEFIRLYNEIDHHLRRLLDSHGSEPFWKRVKLAARRNPVIYHIREDLLEFHELRNAIIHHHNYPETVIAVPTEELVETMRKAVSDLTAPRLVMPDFKREIRVFEQDGPLRDALYYMAKTEFSQIVARIDGKLELLTTDRIARWLLKHVGEEPVSLENVSVGEVLAADQRESMVLVSRDTTVAEARAIFERGLKRRHPRLYAIVITEHGRPEEVPLGLITPRDLLEDPPRTGCDA